MLRRLQLRRRRPCLLALVMLLPAAACQGANGPAPDGVASAESAEEPVTAGPSPLSPASAAEERRTVRAWVAVEGGRTVSEVDVRAGRVVANFPLSGRPHNLTVAPDGTVAATLQSAGRLALIRNGRVSYVELGASPHDVKATTDMLVVANEGTARIQMVSLAGEELGFVALKANPHDLAISRDGGTAWVSLDGSGDLAVVNLRERRLTGYLATENRPHDLRVADDGRLWVTDWTGPLFVYTPEGNQVGRVELGEESHHLAFSTSSGEAWVTDFRAKQVFVVDGDSLSVRTTLAMDGGPHHVAIAASEQLAAVADNENGTLVVFDMADRSPVVTVPVGSGPHGVWIA